jgi:hypothetical protein
MGPARPDEYDCLGSVQDRLPVRPISVGNDIDKQKAERIRAAFAARKVNKQRLTRVNRTHVALGIAAYPELGLDEEIRDIVSDFTREKLLSLMEQAEKLGREEMEKRSRKTTPPTEDRTPIPDHAWEIAAEKFKKYKGNNGV